MTSISDAILSDKFKNQEFILYNKEDNKSSTTEEVEKIKTNDIDSNSIVDSKSKSEKKNFIIFIVFSVIGLGLTELIMWFGTDIIKINYLIVKIIATGIVMIFNFITRKIFLE